MQKGEQILVSHNVTGGPNEVNTVDLQLHLHVFCNKSPLCGSLSPPLLYASGKVWAAATSKRQQRGTFITAFKMMERKAPSSHQWRCQLNTSNYRKSYLSNVTGFHFCFQIIQNSKSVLNYGLQTCLVIAFPTHVTHSTTTALLKTHTVIPYRPFA